MILIVFGLVTMLCAIVWMAIGWHYSIYAPILLIIGGTILLKGREKIGLKNKGWSIFNSHSKK